MHERNRALWDTLRERFDSSKPAVQYEQIAVAPNERLSVSPTAEDAGWVSSSVALAIPDVPRAFVVPKDRPVPF
jgi:hypothetical protein